MPKLTKRSLKLVEGYSTDYHRNELAQKLGAIEHHAASVAEDLCSFACVHAQEQKDQYEMEMICSACPLTRLMELIE